MFAREPVLEFVGLLQPFPRPILPTVQFENVALSSLEGIEEWRKPLPKSLEVLI